MATPDETKTETRGAGAGKPPRPPVGLADAEPPRRNPGRAFAEALRRYRERLGR